MSTAKLGADYHTALHLNPPSGSLPIRATLYRRIITLCAISVAKHIRRRQSSTVLFLSDKYCVKYGPDVNLSEAASMQFISQHTSIPVPKVYCAFKHKKLTYIVMEHLKGHDLSVRWVWRSKESQAAILAQLKLMIDEMRALRPPHASKIASVDGGSLYDDRLPGTCIVQPKPTPRRFGPFADANDFHRWLRRPCDDEVPTLPAGINELIRIHKATTDWGPPVFTHSDLSSFNVLVEGEKVMGIVDWERAGWYPSYWEYTTASQVSPSNMFWADYIDQFLEPRPEELEMENLRVEYFW